MPMFQMSKSLFAAAAAATFLAACGGSDGDAPTPAPRR